MDGISVIIPIYNVEDYIEDCLESIIISIGYLSNIQVILVNDGTKDKSGEIAQRYCAKFTNCFYVTKENGGLSDARNYGLKYVKYNYVTFIDSDDYIAENYFSSILKAKSSQPDIIIFDWIDVSGNNNFNLVKGMENKDELWTIQPSAWNKVYKTELFENVKFPKGKIYEDVGTIYKLLINIKNYIYINEPLYNYRKNREGSILSTISSNINDIYDVLEDTYSFYKINNRMSKKNNQGLCYQFIKLLMWSNMYRQLKYHKLNIIGFHLKMKHTRSLIYSLFPNWKENMVIENNQEFFNDRFGVNYIFNIDNLGKNIFSTIFVTIKLIIKNNKRA